MATSVKALTTEELVESAYADIGRVGIGDEPTQIDPAGREYWIGQLESGAVSKEDFGRLFEAAARTAVQENPEEPTNIEVGTIYQKRDADIAFQIEQARLEEENRAAIEALNKEIEQEQTKINTEIEQEQIKTNTEFERARAEVEAMNKREAEYMAVAQAEYAQQQAAAQAAAEAESRQFEQMQAELDRQRQETQRQAEEIRARNQAEREGFQRETAEREVTSRRAGRTTTARPLITAAMGDMAAAPSLGMAAGIGGAGAGALGGATALGGTR